MDVFERIRQAHLPSADDSAESILSEVGFLERQIRLAVCLSAAIGRIYDIPPKLPRRGGFGEYLRLGVYLGASLAEHEPSIARLWDRINSSVSRPQNGLDYNSAQSFRNYLMHGGVVPSGRDARAAVTSVREEVESAISEWIDTRGGILARGQRLELGDGTTLHPFVMETADGIATYHDATESVISYSTTSRECPRKWIRRGDPLYVATQILLEDPSPRELRSVSRDFVAALKQDIGAFAESGTAPTLSQMSSPLRVDWSRRTSEGSELRSDSFRIAKGGAWQWRRGDSWRPYEEFLVVVANWRIVLERVLRRHRSVQAAEKRLAQSSSLSHELILPPSVLPRFRATESVTIAGRTHRPDDAVAFEQVVDESAEATIGQPEVFFVAGEAGVGKTHNLVAASLHRSERLVEAVDKEDRSVLGGSPLYLYVSCSGVGLRSLRDLINAAVVETQNLTYESVMALCRNGMLVLVIDGFDELLGGAGYRDAFQLLEPTLRLLGLRGGTVVLSARSSYLANQYKNSLARSSVEAKTPVAHYMLELLRWNAIDVENLFNSNPSWGPVRPGLERRDLTLLGVPFFARVFNEYCLSDAPASGRQVHLRDLLIDAYVGREVGKLSGIGQERGIDSSSLRALMCELAGMMFDSGVYVLSQEDFELACVSALDLEDQTRHRALLDRLTVLCGMAVEVEGADGALMFAFEHEVIFETLLGEYFSTLYFSGRDLQRMHEALTRGLLGQSTVSGLVDRRPDEVQTFLASADFRRAETSDEYKTNVGALVSAVADSRGVLATDCRSLELDRLDLTKVSGGQSLRGCVIRQLVVGGALPISLTLENCKVDSLELHDVEAAKVSLSLGGASEIAELLAFRSGVAENLVSGHSRVLRALRDMGYIAAHHGEMGPADSWTELQVFAQESLGPLRGQNGGSYVVPARTRVPGNEGSRWCRRPTDPRWAQLTNALLAAGLATEKRINASGPAKLSIIIRADISTLLDRDSDGEFEHFWSLLA